MAAGRQFIGSQVSQEAVLLAQEIAQRLNRNTEELKRAMLWALEEMRGLDRCVRP